MSRVNRFPENSLKDSWDTPKKKVKRRPKGYRLPKSVKSAKS